MSLCLPAVRCRSGKYRLRPLSQGSHTDAVVFPLLRDKPSTRQHLHGLLISFSIAKQGPGSYQADTARQYHLGPIPRTCLPIQDNNHVPAHSGYSQLLAGPGLFCYKAFVPESACPVDSGARPAGRHKPALTQKTMFEGFAYLLLLTSDRSSSVTAPSCMYCYLREGDAPGKTNQQNDKSPGTVSTVSGLYN